MKRLLAFLVLLALGIVALRIAIGDEAVVRKTKDETGQPAKRQPAEPPGIGLQQGRMGASVTQSGPLVVTRWRDVPLSDGRVRKEEAYVLKAEDSRPVGEGLQQLTGVTLQLFDEGSPAATVRAREAFVELGRDANGQPAFDEQKEIDLRETVVTTEAGSRAAGLRLELGDALVIVGDEEIQLRTAADQAVRLTVEGDRPATLTGLGAKARLPRDREGGLRRSDIEILRDPVLATADLRVQATGRMHYVEDVITGAAQITLDDDVMLDLERAGLTLPGLAPTPDGEPTRSSVRGDQFTGWLLRSPAPPGADDRRPVTWQRLVLVGAPATVELPGMRVSTPRLTVLPGPLGEPFVVTAHGGESRIEQTELRAGSKQTDVVTGTSPRRIHLIRPGDAVGALHRNFGFPRWTLRSLDQQQVVVFEGATRLESGARTLIANEGLLVVSRAQGQTGIVRGFGPVEIRQRGTATKPGGTPQPDLVAHGSDGMLLTVGETWERLRLGPDDPTYSSRWREHRYDVRFGEAKLVGVGGCEVERAGERTRLQLAAPFDEIEADFAQNGTELRNVHRLDAVLDGERLAELDVGGLPVRATLAREGERVLAQAPRLLQIGPRSLRLLPMELEQAPWTDMAEIDRTPRLLRDWRSAPGEQSADTSIEVLGPCIDVHHAGGRNVIVDATGLGDDLPRVYARLPQPGGREPTTVTCAAERLRILPFVLTPEMRRFHLGGAVGPTADLTFHALAQPWLLVDRVRDFQLDDAAQGHIEGTGDRLFVAQGGAAALFIGSADDLIPAVVERTLDGRSVQMEGARVRVYQDDAVRLTALGSFADRSPFLAPTLTLREPGATGLLSNMRAVCRGDIQVDPDAVRFGGPVVATGLAHNGEDDPDGVQIDAEQLTMQRQAMSGEVVRITGQGVTVDWTRLDARAASVELDLLTRQCIAKDPAGATVDLPDGRSLRSPRIEINYDTWSFSMGRGRIFQRGQVQEGTR